MKLTTTALLAIASLSTVNAATLTWTGATDNVWTGATNWNPNQTPASSDDLIINSGTPSQGANWNISGGGSVTIAGGDVTWSGRFNTVGNGSAANVLITSGSLSVNYAGGSSHAFNVGNGGLGGERIFRQQGGTVNAINSNDEISLKSDGIYEISGGILNAGSIFNGIGSTGRFNIIGEASTINLGSGYTQSSTGTLDLNIGSSISLIDASANVSLAGTLDVEFASTPSVNDTFDIIDYGGSLSGTFDTFDTVVDSPDGPDSVTLSIDYGSGSADKVVLTVTAVGGDDIPPTLDSFANNVGNGPISDTQTVIYTVTFSEAMEASTIEASDFENAGSSAATINSVNPTGNPAAFEVSVSPGSGTGTLQLQIMEGANMEDPAANPLETTPAIKDPVIITVNADDIPPTLDSFANNVGDGPIFDSYTVTYTVTFSEAMKASTIEASDFENAGSPAATISSVNPTGDPAVFEVSVSPGSGTGTLQLQIVEGANMEDLASLPLDTTPAIKDPVTITVFDFLTTPVAWTGATSNDWLEPSNWIPSKKPASSDNLEVGAGTAILTTQNWNISGGGSVTINGGDVTWSGRFNTVGNGSAGNVLITGGSLSVNYAEGQSHAFNIGNGGGVGVFQQQGGTVNALNDNDEITIKSDSIYEISGGVLNAGSIINGDGPGTFNIIGDASTINLTGATSYRQTDNSTLKLDIGSGISPIAATGNVNLDGTLEVAFQSRPSFGQSFTIMNYGGILTGAFDFDGLGDSPLGPDTVMLSIDYGTGTADAVVLTVDAAPEPLVLKIDQNGGSLDFEWNSLRGMQYDLLSSTDLSTDPATWLPYNDGVTTYENIPATEMTTTLSGVLTVGPIRFFALIEEDNR